MGKVQIGSSEDILMDNKLITEEDFNLVFQNAKGISKQLGGFKKKLL